MQLLTLNICDLKENLDYKTFYSEIPNRDLEEIYARDGDFVPISVDADHVIIDGYRRVSVIRRNGARTIQAIVLPGNSGLSKRVELNKTRNKTDDEKVKEFKVICESNPKRQGQHKTDGKPYKRHEIISAYLNNRFRGDKIIKKLEYISNNDLAGNLLLKNILNDNWKVQPCYDFITKYKILDQENNYGFTNRIIDGEFSIEEANRLIEQKHNLNNGYSCTFIIPEKCNSYNINCIDIMQMNEFHGQVDLIFTSIPYYRGRKYDSSEADHLGHQKTPQEYAQKAASIIESLIPTLKPTANFILNIGESYNEFCGLRIPNLMIDSIVKNTSLIYKDTLYWSKSNPKPVNDSVRRPWNCMEYLLWFVVDPKRAKYKTLTYPDKEKRQKVSAGVKDIHGNGNISIGKISISGEYRRIYTHLEEQKITQIIRAAAQKNHEVYKIYEEGHPAIMTPYLPLVPILSTTDEHDLVFDPFAGTNVVGRMSILLNRRALSTEISKHYYQIGCKMLESGVQDFDGKSLTLMNNIIHREDQTQEINLLSSEKNLTLGYHEN